MIDKIINNFSMNFMLHSNNESFINSNLCYQNKKIFYSFFGQINIILLLPSIHYPYIDFNHFVLLNLTLHKIF